MRFREKLLILFIAFILSGLGFYLISSPFVDLHVSAKIADADSMESYRVKNGDDASLIHNPLDSSLKITRFNYYSNHSRFFCTPGANQ